MSSAAPPSVAFQKSIINTGLNSGVLLAFFMGAYTVIHFGTLYLYMTRRASQRFLVAGSMSVMWILASTLLGSIWFGMNWCIVLHGDTREDIARCAPPSWIILLQDLTEFLIVIVADGLLVWRCFHVWNRSLWITAFPIFLTLVEIGTFTAAIIAISVDKFTPDPRQASAYNSLLAAAFFLSFATTLITTSLIGYRIWSVSHHLRNSKGRYSSSDPRFFTTVHSY
ncbi:hypothetical protein CPB84DRAFT_645904 [Gymnopilus junonius]|uniref:Uncharacterized protein n=1 Tax=Gymnopilus junonius TaxID=109634 RepID=A0A9P5TGU8_GYMJU|nr:hypothetical protein CPB84DRAFT_645904 [Gymnopilus junonius]